MLTKKLLIALSAIILIAAFALISGCSNDNNPVESLAGSQIDNIDLNQTENGSEVDKHQSSTEIYYTGTESLEEMLSNYYALVDSGIIDPFSDEELEDMIKAFDNRSKNVFPPTIISATIIAYTAHYVWSGHDYDLWLEYKWWAGSPRGYHFETPIWSLYWAIRICYGWNITNWWWMEGSYQRVTAVVGTCVYRTHGAEFTRRYLRLVTH